MTFHEKQVLTLRQFLLGRGYHRALKAMEFACRYHTGVRKDLVTPEFNHQIVIALFALTLPAVTFPEELIAVIFLHDVREDYDVSDVEIRALFGPGDFADRVANAVERMTKTYRGVKKDPVALFEDMATDPIASIAKLCDRVHNYLTMIGVFTVEKQKAYIAEGKEFFLPMGKAARRNFPEQNATYENLKFMLNCQIQLIEAMHSATNFPGFSYRTPEERSRRSMDRAEKSFQETSEEILESIKQRDVEEQEARARELEKEQHIRRAIIDDNFEVRMTERVQALHYPTDGGPVDNTGPEGIRSFRFDTKRLHELMDQARELGDTPIPPPPSAGDEPAVIDGTGLSPEEIIRIVRSRQGRDL